MSSSHELGGSSDLDPVPSQSSVRASDPPNVDPSFNAESVYTTPPDTFTANQARMYRFMIRSIARRARDGTSVMDDDMGLGVGGDQPGETQVGSASSIYTRDETASGLSRRRSAVEQPGDRIIASFDVLTPVEQAHVLEAADADDEEEEDDDATIRGINDDDSDIDEVVDLCGDAPPRTNQAHPPHDDQRGPTTNPDRRNRRVSFLSPPTGSITIYDPENATSADGTYELPFEVALPFALGPMMPLIRFILLGWVLGVTFMVIVTCVCLGIVLAFWKAVWDLLTGWRKKKDSPVSRACQSSAI